MTSPQFRLLLLCVTRFPSFQRDRRKVEMNEAEEAHRWRNLQGHPAASGRKEDSTSVAPALPQS